MPQTKILIVDDTPYNLRILSLMLSNQGYQILEAENGIDGITIAVQEKPDLILLDIKMPVVDGYQVCATLKNNPITQDIPVIFISALENVEEKVEAFAVGGVDFVNKPFHLVEILARLETHLRISYLQSELVQKTKILESQNTILKQEISSLTGFNWKFYEEMENAIANHQMELFYQPIVNFESNLVRGFEALVRWRHPEKGLLPPITFIDFVESTDLIYALGKWTLEAACQQLHIWQTKFPEHKNLTMSVNVSTKQLQEIELFEFTHKILDEYEIEPSCLKMEITEGAVMTDIDRTLKIVCEFKDLGVQFCIDDFGTGYSSLRRLTDFPIDVLKIDRSFINNEEWIIVKAIGTLAFALDKSIVVEGIETMQQLKILKDIFHTHLSSCYAQGYLFAKPQEANVAANLLKVGFPNLK